jgi:hypothetical protein
MPTCHVPVNRGIWIGAGAITTGFPKLALERQKQTGFAGVHDGLLGRRLERLGDLAGNRQQIMKCSVAQDADRPCHIEAFSMPRREASPSSNHMTRLRESRVD